MCKRVIAILTIMMTLLSNVLTPYSYVMASGTDSSVGENNNWWSEVVVENTIPWNNDSGDLSSPKMMNSWGTRWVTETNSEETVHVDVNLTLDGDVYWWWW